MLVSRQAVALPAREGGSEERQRHKTCMGSLAHMYSSNVTSQMRSKDSLDCVDTKVLYHDNSKLSRGRQSVVARWSPRLQQRSPPTSSPHSAAFL